MAKETIEFGMYKPKRRYIHVHTKNYVEYFLHLWGLGMLFADTTTFHKPVNPSNLILIHHLRIGNLPLEYPSSP